MREILYRAKIAGTDQWVEGLPHTVYGNVIDSIMTFDRRVEYIKTDTICEFAGLTDKNGTKIFEGDIIKFKTTRYHTKKQKVQGIAKAKWFKSPVLYQEGAFFINENSKTTTNVDDFDTFFSCCFGKKTNGDFIPEVIGNIYDNTKLLE